MSDEAIKTEIEVCYAAINQANDKLSYLRKECNHNETKRTNYMWAPGHIMHDALVCSICGELLINK